MTRNTRNATTAAAPIALAALLALLAGPAGAQQQAEGEQGRQGPARMQAEVARGQGGERATLPHFRGRVLRTKTVRVPGPDKSHLAALIRTSGGRTIVADLGVAGGADVEAGERITVVGHPGRIGNQIVVFAKTFAVGGGEDVNVERVPTPLEAGWRPEQRQVRGKVAGVREVGLRGGGGSDGGQKVLVALVETGGGQRVAVDLGSAGELGGKLRKGDEVAVRGREVMVGDRIVLLGSQLRAGDRTYDLNRPAKTAARGGGHARSARGG